MDNTITLSLPAADIHSQAYRTANMFGKPELTRVIRPLISSLAQYEVSILPGSDPALCEIVEARHNPDAFVKFRKDRLIQFYISFSSVKENFIAIARALPQVHDLMDALCRRPYLDYMDACGYIPGLTIERVSTWQRYIILDLRVAGCVPEWENNYYTDNWRDDVRFHLKPSDRKIFLAQLNPVLQAPTVLSELPTDSSLTEIAVPQDEIYGAAVYLARLYMEGKLLPASGHITPTKINLLLRKMPPFKALDRVPEYLTRWVSPLSLFILAYGTYVSYYNPKKRGVDPADMGHMAKYVAKKMGKALETTDFGIFIPGYQGFTSRLTDGHNADTVTSVIGSLLKESDTGWLDVGSIYPALLSVEGKEFDGMLFCDYGLRHSGLSRKIPVDSSSYRTRTSSLSRKNQSVDWWGDITCRFVTGWIWMLCVSGLVELAIDPTADRADTWDGIRYIRLTPLGRYGFALTKKYTSQANAGNAGQFDLDEENAIVTVLDPTSPYCVVLRQTGIAIGGNRFKLTPASIVAGSRTTDIAKSNIEMLTNILSPGTSGRWKEILDEARLRTQASIADPSDYFALYRLNPAVPGLIDFIVSNSEICSNTVKAEQSFILVKVGFDSRFRELLIEGGYIL